MAKTAPKTEPEITLATLPSREPTAPTASVNASAGEIPCYGVFRVKGGSTGGLWVIRKVLTDGNNVSNVEDSEPDTLDIQMGKIDRYIENATEANP